MTLKNQIFSPLFPVRTEYFSNKKLYFSLPGARDLGLIKLKLGNKTEEGLRTIKKIINIKI